MMSRRGCQILSPHPLLPPPRFRHAPRRRGRAVHAVLWDGSVKGTFPSDAEAADAMGVGRNAIVCAASYGRRSCGYWWRYADTAASLQPLQRGVYLMPRRYIPTAYQPKPTVVFVSAPRGTVVSGQVYQAPVPTPSRHRNARPSECVDSETLDSVGSIDPTLYLPESLNPRRAGHASSSYERGRFELAHRHNPALTWEGWQDITRRMKPGRRPKVKL
jgi:hypothetical protein